MNLQAASAKSRTQSSLNDPGCYNLPKSISNLAAFQAELLFMLQIKIGIHLPSLRMPLRQAISIAAKLGADAVEIDARGELKPADLTQTALRQMRKMLEDQRLRVCAVNFRTRRGYGTLQDLDAR